LFPSKKPLPPAPSCSLAVAIAWAEEAVTIMNVVFGEGIRIVLIHILLPAYKYTLKIFAIKELFTDYFGISVVLYIRKHFFWVEREKKK
jgi:hypothetical protein